MNSNMTIFGLVLIILSGNMITAKQIDSLYSNESDTCNFVIRWAFQDLCHFVFDPWIETDMWPTRAGEGVSFDPSMVKPGDIIFVRKAYIFFEKLHPLIKYPYILITGGEERDRMAFLPTSYLDDPKIIAWFGIHPCEKKHAKYYPIPLGILQEPKNYTDRTNLNNFMTSLRKNSVKDCLLYLNFNDPWRPERVKVRSLFKDAGYCRVSEGKPFEEYLIELAKSKFILSPPGCAPDCYRTWESLLVGSIPIVIKSQLDNLFEGLPVLIIDKWEDINEQFLNEQYVGISQKKFDIKRLYMEYWQDKINLIRNQFLEKTNGDTNV